MCSVFVSYTCFFFFLVSCFLVQMFPCEPWTTILIWTVVIFYGGILFMFGMLLLSFHSCKTFLDDLIMDDYHGWSWLNLDSFQNLFVFRFNLHLDLYVVCGDNVGGFGTCRHNNWSFEEYYVFGLALSFFHDSNLMLIQGVSIIMDVLENERKRKVFHGWIIRVFS